ncbi:MAG: putative porin, partial [Saprospiraceae bacterium]|nr:putative porin [Saprospiraceae bacterium]
APGLADERQGLVVSAKLGTLQQRGDWTVQLHFARLERYAVVDYFAQNDWARWDYSSDGSPAARLSNMQGFELRVGYALDPGVNIVAKWFQVEQLVRTGLRKETGARARVDLNVAF